MKIVLLITGVLITVSLGSVKSLACTVAEFDAAAQLEGDVGQKMRDAALAAYSAEGLEVISISWTNADGGYIWNSPMCPEGFKLSGDLVVNANNTLDSLSKGCTAVISVKRIYAKALNVMSPTPLKIPGVDKFEIEVKQSMTCLE